MKKPLPHLQFAILGVLGRETLAGRVIRARLRDLGVAKSGPTFYRLMGRLEESEFVTGWYEQEVVDGQIVRERHYRVTALGRKARDETARFHQRIMASYMKGGEAHA